MIGATDYVGIGTLITAIGATVVSIIVAIRQPRIGAKVNEIHEQIATSNGHTLGELVEKNESRHPEDPIGG